MSRYCGISVNLQRLAKMSTIRYESLQCFKAIPTFTLSNFYIMSDNLRRYNSVDRGTVKSLKTTPLGTSKSVRLKEVSVL